MLRRHFLTSSTLLAGAASLPHVLPSHVLGADGATAPGNQLTIGGNGVGGMGTNNLRNFLSLQGCRVVAGCDVMAAIFNDPYRMKQGCRFYGDTGWTL